ncbi:hypothetical protein BC833DRAFT_309935 [Globomyces pollinis-pini]|nr:hypothetical protein BC833DRAFT_309935 [Globomyces pollinis-pini]
MKKRKEPVTCRKRTKDTQQIISKYHTLAKQLHQMKKLGNSDKVQSIEQEIHELGGLDTYQRASLKGGDMNKGFGGSGRWLINQLKILFPKSNKQLTMLDVGAISGEVYMKHSFLKVTSIDLNSQSPLVLKQDFFQRPIPTDDNDRFDIVSLSLVINFLTDPEQRGLMLSIVSKHLKPDGLFYLVLPLPCISNSRYLNDKHLQHIIELLGYQLIVSHCSKKLVYYLFQLKNPPDLKCDVKKVLLDDGPKKNNFAITLNL